MEEKLQQILRLVQEYVEEKQSSKTWKPGEDWVQYSGPYLSSKEYIRAIDTFLKGWLVLGEEAMEFERKFPPLLGKEYGIVTNSGSSANLLMMAALTSRRLYNFPKGTKILTPVAGFPTTLNPLLQFGFKPVFVDIQLDNLNLDVDRVESALERHEDIRAITFAHVLANPPNMDKLMNLVKEYKLILLEDCCDALGTTYDGKLLGSFGELATCSFYPAHHITMGEGGFVACRTKEQETIVRSLREWGRGCYCVGKKQNLLKCGMCKKRFSNWLPSMPDYVFDHKYVYEEIGYNLKPIELQCSIGLEQIERLPEIHARRIQNYEWLMEKFLPYEDRFILPRATEKAKPSWFAFPLTIKDGVTFKRSDICQFFEDNKIQTRNYFGGNLLLQPAYAGLEEAAYNIPKDKYPNATKVTTDTFFLGTSPVLLKEQIDYIGEVLERFMKNL